MTNRLQPIYDIAAICAQKNIKHAIVCPGSRNAPLVLAFTRHPNIKSRTISDERSAAFIALGISQQTQMPAVLISTSGTAVFNFAPAIAEAYFNKTPLIVFTADRPSEWIAQQDGQTIYQQDIFGRHVKQSFQLSQHYDHADSIWGINRMVNEAINLSLQAPHGPVHINIPFREPLYPLQGELINYSENIRVIESLDGSLGLNDEAQTMITKEWHSFNHVLVVAGQQYADNNEVRALDAMITQHRLPLVADIISNLHGLSSKVSHADVFLAGAADDVKRTLQPDLLITFGNSIISKSLKLFLRKFSARRHWHIQEAGSVSDTYQSITNIILTRPEAFFTFITNIPRTESFESQKQSNYTKLWEVEERRAQRALSEFFPQKEFGEFEVVREVMKHLIFPCNLHLANSMSVRYANYVGLDSEQAHVTVYANRGTSGIDGCTSTAVGHALVEDGPHIIITGDMAFFYDRNAFWHNYPLSNLKILVINNHGGVIFKMIDGPADVPEANEFFITEQKLTAKKLCEEFGFEYLRLDNRRKMKNFISDFMESSATTKVLEIESSLELNKEIFDALKLKIKKSYEL